MWSGGGPLELIGRNDVVVDVVVGLVVGGTDGDHVGVVSRRGNGAIALGVVRIVSSAIAGGNHDHNAALQAASTAWQRGWFL